MADLAKVDLSIGSKEAKLRALLEDLVDYYKGVYPERPLALAVWFGKSTASEEHNLLVLFTGRGRDQINRLPRESLLSWRESLLWKSGSNEPPFVNICSTSIDYFAEQLNSNPQELTQYSENFEVLCCDKDLLPEPIVRKFNVITEPSGLMKGWYVSAHEYEDTKAPKVRNLLARWSPVRPDIGLVKVWESPDFEHCRGLLHMEVSFPAGKRWLPISHGGLAIYSFHTEYQDGRPGYLLFRGGSLYQIQKFEEKTAPEYSSQVLEPLRDDRYPEVYLRAVHPPEQSTPHAVPGDLYSIPNIAWKTM